MRWMMYSSRVWMTILNSGTREMIWPNFCDGKHVPTSAYKSTFSGWFPPTDWCLGNRWPRCLASTSLRPGISLGAGRVETENPSSFFWNFKINLPKFLRKNPKFLENNKKSLPLNWSADRFVTAFVVVGEFVPVPARNRELGLALVPANLYIFNIYIYDEKLEFQRYFSKKIVESSLRST